MYLCDVTGDCRTRRIDEARPGYIDLNLARGERLGGVEEAGYCRSDALDVPTPVNPRAPRKLAWGRLPVMALAHGSEEAA